MKTKVIEAKTKQRAPSEIFEMKTANKWIEAMKNRPMPGMLFGELWLENEVAILFSDTGKGKSLLAVQIGESIARGFSIAPLKMSVKPQKVLYFDFELSAKQFEMRYAGEDGRGDVHPGNHYEFSENFNRLEIRLESGAPEEYRTFERHVQYSIEAIVKESGARVLIIDNITYLRRSNESTREAVPLMRELKRLKEIYGLSILVLAHTPKRDCSRPITVNDLQGSKVLSNFADNIFAIGQSRLDTDVRYIKHIKPRSTGLIYDGSNVLCFRIAKFDDRFLGFQHYGYSPETVHLADASTSRERDLMESIRAMSERNMSIRQIADELRVSKSQVQRLLKKWTPETRQFDEDDEVFGDRISRTPADAQPAVNPYYFPGREEYNEAKDDARYNGIYSTETEETPRLRREAYVLELATEEARQVYLKTGTAPRLHDVLKNHREFARREHEFCTRDCLAA